MGLFGNKSFNKKKTGVRKSVSLNNLKQDPTVRQRDSDPDNVSIWLWSFSDNVQILVDRKIKIKFHLPFDSLHADYYPVRDHKLLFIVILVDYHSLAN